jgi:Arc/MetJ family transcription regulator
MDVFSAVLPQQTTTSGKPRQRIKWDDEMNTFIMRSYYTLTRNETDMAMYRQKIHQAFTKQYPNIPITKQRIADQRRTIVQRKLLPDITINMTRQEVAKSLTMNLMNMKTETLNTILTLP